ncbi:MAG TPA: hypothetical protein VFU65_18635 [Actinocrinis sp.]|nr:hypothetical protein [Actinocrinis sp.]
MSTKRLSSAVVGTTLLASILHAPVAEAATTTASVTLPLAHYSRILADPVHHHLFITEGTGYNTVLVTDYAGTVVATLDNEPGATGLVISPDGNTVYVGLADAGAVSAISTRSLTEVSRYATGDGTSPTYVAYTAGKIWFSYESDYQGMIGSIDPHTSPAKVVLAASPDTWGIPPVLAANRDGELVAGEPSQSPNELASYDVSSGAVVVLAPQVFEYEAGNMGDLQITPDGSDVVVASGAPYHHEVFKVSDLSTAGEYDTATYPNSVAIAADGTVIAGSENYYGDSIYVFAPGRSAAVTSYPLPPTTYLAPAGLAVTPDGNKLFAITADPYGNSPVVLNIIARPEQTSSTLTLSGPTQVHEHKPIAVSGTLGGASPYTAGQVLCVTRVSSNGKTAVLPDVVTAADGSFSFTDTPRGAGTVTYRVSYVGSAHLTASSASITIPID